MVVDRVRARRVIGAFHQFFDSVPPPVSPEQAALDLFQETAATVPAYRKFLAARCVDPHKVRTMDDFHYLPLMDKESYHHAFPLPERCRDGRLEWCDLVSVSSGSSGTPTVWPRTVTDELTVARRFEQVFRDSFGAAGLSTLAVVCFPLGTWVGGLFTTACVRHLAAKGYPITTVAPGNNKAEILRVLPELAPHFQQVVLLGYPPFLKTVIDAGAAEGVQWSDYAVKLVFAGEVFSERWRDLVSERVGMSDPIHGTASLYGTADAGVLGTETPLSIAIRRFLAARPELAREVFGDVRLPTLVQYDPRSRYFEAHDGTLLFTADGGVPLVRYHIADEGGVLGHRELLDLCTEHGFQSPTTPDLPFVYVFGRSLFTVSFFGANIFPEHVAAGFEHRAVSDWVTGKFVIEVLEDDDADHRLRITAELAPSRDGDPDALATTVRDTLLGLSSEFAHYVPIERQLPEVRLRPFEDPEYFPPGVKHRYTAAPTPR